jgi:hypothetical protein
VEKKNIRSTLSSWKKTFAALLVLFILGLLLALYLNMRFVDVLFIEGLLIFAFGAFVAAGMGNPRTVDMKNTIADPEFYREYLENQRPNQVREGIILMILGAVLIILSIVIGLSTIAP